VCWIFSSVGLVSKSSFPFEIRTWVLRFGFAHLGDPDLLEPNRPRESVGGARVSRVEVACTGRCGLRTFMSNMDKRKLRKTVTSKKQSSYVRKMVFADACKTPPYIETLHITDSTEVSKPCLVSTQSRS